MEFLALLATSGLLCVPAWYVARRRKSWFGWDYVSVFAPMPFWYALFILQIGAQSLSNLVELLIVGAFVPMAVSCRVFLLDRISQNSIRSSVLTCAICLVVPLGLRLGMPLLPE